MNGRNKYAEQFDRNAGEPADFDSLFRFEKGELITKKRIKMHSSRRKKARTLCLRPARYATSSASAARNSAGDWQQRI